MAYKTKYRPRIKSKYIGSTNNIICRSLWERSLAKWCDSNPKVLKWCVEPFSIPYFDTGKNKFRKYFPDFYIEMDTGKKFLIEVKPKYETHPPKMRKGSRKHLIAESTWVTNSCKWKVADKYCRDKGWTFKIVTEDTLKDMGIKIITRPPRRKAGTSKKRVKYTNKTSSGKK